MGTVRDVVPQRFGVSGRVVELAIVGSDGELVLDGLRVRWGLGLRENLFVIDRERDAAGNVTRFVFTGKGWGHGVGLCQVGSFGMAQAGSHLRADPPALLHRHQPAERVLTRLRFFDRSRDRPVNSRCLHQLRWQRLSRSASSRSWCPAA